MMLGFMVMDYWWVVIPGLLLGMYAQAKLTSAYGRYSQMGNAAGMTGAQAAREVLDSAGLDRMPVEETRGHLTDHYDPSKKALFLSSENYHGTSLAAVGVAAHEAGHALQDKAGYMPLHIRMSIVPATQLSVAASGIMFMLGLIFGISWLMALGIVLFSVFALFQLITLPVEYDASRRAKEQLFRLGLIRENERSAVSKVLNAAALTYVAALAMAALQLAQYIMIFRGRERS